MFLPTFLLQIQRSSRYAIRTLLNHWITKTGSPKSLITDRSTEYNKQDLTHLCSLFVINHTPRTSYSPRRNGLAEVQTRNRGTQSLQGLRNYSTKWSFQTRRYANAHNTTPLSQPIFSPYQTYFHQHFRLPLTFSTTLLRNSSKNCNARFCDSLPHTHYIDRDVAFFSNLSSLNLSFYGLYQQNM